jgi:hypothetical protein
LDPASISEWTEEPGDICVASVLSELISIELAVGIEKTISKRKTHRYLNVTTLTLLMNLFVFVGCI